MYGSRRGVDDDDALTRLTTKGEIMDISSFTKSDWMKLGGAIGIFIFGFFDWVTFEAFGFSESGGNVFDFFWTGMLPWFLIIGVGVLTVLLVLKVLSPTQAPWPLIMLAATGLAAFLLLMRLLFNPIEGSDLIESAGGDIGRGFGMYLSVISGLVAFAGAFLGFKESGGDLNDLKDVNKLKGQFSSGSGAAPASSTPPPPPPPPAGPDSTPPPPPPAV